MSNRRVRGLAIARPIVYGNDAHLIPLEERTSDHTHRWTVAVRSATSPPPPEDPSQLNPIGGLDDLSYFIKKVTFKLHETIPNSLRTCDKPPFEVTETGWGEFEVQIKIFFAPESNEKPLTFYHHLKLHPWPLAVHVGPNNMIPGNDERDAPGEEDTEMQEAPAQEAPAAAPTNEKAEAPEKPTATNPAPPSGTASQGTEAQTGEPAPAEPTLAQLIPGLPPLPPEVILTPVRSWQYDEIVFTEPTEAFYKVLVSNPPTPLPAKPYRPKPDLAIPVGAGGNMGELSKETEDAEGLRLELARKEVLGQMEAIRTRLVEDEKKLKALKDGLEAAEEANAAA